MPVSIPLGDASLVAPVPGLMIWTLVAFLVTLWLLKKFALGRIAAAIEDRRRLVRENLEASEHARDEANRLLEEYKAQLAASRREATEIVERARRTGEELSRQLREEANAQREKDIAAARSAIEAETRQSLDRIKQEVADLTLLATEKVVGRTLDGAEQKRLIDEALAEVDFAALAGPAEDG